MTFVDFIFMAQQALGEVIMKTRERSSTALRSPSDGASAAASAVIEWLAGNECHDLDEAALVGELGRRFSLAGLPLDRLSLHFRTLHPALAGRTIAWAPDEPVEVYEAEHATAASMTFRENPAARVMDTGECVVVRAGEKSFPSWNAIELFKGRGLREFFVAPLNTGEGPVGIVIFGTLRVSGFSPIDHALLERVLPILRTSCELRALRRLELPLLHRFAGTQTVERLLGSGLLRHRVETTGAALMLVKFGTYGEDLEPALVEETIRKTALIVSRLGGFVLSIDDESMLVMFPQEARMACRAAVAAAEHITETTKDQDSSSETSPGIVLHYGELTYGQITTPFGVRLAMSGRDVHHLKKLGHVAGRGITLSQHFSELAGVKKDAGLVSA